MEPNEQVERAGRGWGWLIVILVAALVAAWGLLSFARVPDVPRTWRYGAPPDAPGESVYSSNPTPREAAPPVQMAPLPEARPAAGSGGAP
jgi:hypothetical protein